MREAGLRSSILKARSFVFGSLFVALSAATTTFACGHPVEMMPRAEVLSRQQDFHLTNVSLPDSWQLPSGHCLVRNYTDCNSEELVANISAGLLLFNADTEFCSPEDEKHLRALFVEVNLTCALLLCMLCLILRLLWRKASSQTT